LLLGALLGAGSGAAGAPGQAEPPPASERTDTCAREPDFSQRFNDGWGNGPANTRFQAASSIARANVASLELAWAFALDDNDSPHSYPVLTTDTLIIGTTDGNLHALDRYTGCVRWSVHVGEPIRSGIVLGELDGEQALFFGTSQGRVFAVAGANGRIVWRAQVGDHPFAMVTGTPAFHDGRLYVPLSSGEVALAISPFYACCTFRGALVSLDATSGGELWRTHLIDDLPEIVGSHWLMVDEWGPSGVPVWSAPTIDVGARRIYVGTGENYTYPPTKRSDAIVALDLDDGAIVWTRQFTRLDTYNMACGLPFFGANCPDREGPDLDFGAPPIRVDVSERALLLAGQKSGAVFALDAGSGEPVWETRFGHGGKLGGVHWGMAVNVALGLVYVPISDVPTEPAGEREPEPGLHAVSIESGERHWSVPDRGQCAGRERCRSGMSAAILATAELVFAAGLDGGLHAFDAETGTRLWSYDTWRVVDAVNGLPARGGAIDVHGPAVANEWLYVQSGYGSFGQRGGNALLAFRAEPGEPR
jgi:polyvinyl alcohol dehydrogenase (cytochrome)